MIDLKKLPFQSEQSNTAPSFLSEKIVEDDKHEAE